MKKRGIWKEFIEFLKEYKILGIAIAFVVGAAASSLVKALVEDIIMPIITPFIPEGAWKTATFVLGPIVVSWGAFLGELINFIIIALAIFIFVIVLPMQFKEKQKVLVKKIKVIPREVILKEKIIAEKLKNANDQSSNYRNK